MVLCLCSFCLPESLRTITVLLRTTQNHTLFYTFILTFFNTVLHSFWTCTAKPTRPVVGLRTTHRNAMQLIVELQ